MHSYFWNPKARRDIDL